MDKKGTVKNVAKIRERIGRLREKNSRVASDYRIEVIADDEKTTPFVLIGSVSPKVHKKISTAVFTA